MDHTAGKPVDARVLEAMTPYFTQSYGNPSSIHSFGIEAREAIEEARGKVAELIGAEKREEIIFTSGGTESNNLAIKGVTVVKRGEAEKVKLGSFPTLKQVMDQAVKAGVKLEVCEQSCMLLGLGRGEFTDASKIVGAATLNDRALDADAVLCF